MLWGRVRRSVLLAAALLLAALAHAGPYDTPLLAPPASPSGPVDPANPFPWTVTVAPLAPGASGRVELKLTVPAGYEVYRDQIEVAVLDAGGLVVGKADLPPGLTRHDPANGTDLRELYDMDVVVYLPVKAPKSMSGTVSLRLELRSQGCKRGLCYPPITVERTVVVPISAA